MCNPDEYDPQGDSVKEPQPDNFADAGALAGDWEQVQQETALWPWLADDSMADYQQEEDYYDGY